MKMLKTLLNLFIQEDNSKFSFFKLYSKLKAWSNSGTLPYEYELPQAITFDDVFWKKIIQIHKDTKNDNHERAFSIFWADGELVVTGVTKGTTSSVTTNSTVSVRYVPNPRHRGYMKREIVVDSEIYSTKDVYYKNVPSKIEVKYLFNIHTHPAHMVGDRELYGFFSLTDLNTLINSNAIITGMIGDKFWLLFKTNKTPKILNNYTKEEISIDSLNEKLKLGVYCGEFGGKLVKQL